MSSAKSVHADRFSRGFRVGLVCAALTLAIVAAAIGVLVDVSFIQDPALREILASNTPHVYVGSVPLKPRTRRTLLSVGDRTVLEVVKNVPPSTRPELKPFVELVARLEGIDPQITTVSPRVQLRGFCRNGTRCRPVTVMGILPRKEAKFLHAGAAVNDESFDALERTPMGIVLSSVVANHLGVEVGSRVSLITATGAVRQFVVVGVFAAHSSGGDSLTTYINLGGAQSLLGLQRNAVSGVAIRLADAGRAERVRDRVEQTIGYSAATWGEANAQQIEFQFKERWLMWVVVVLALIVAVAGVRDALSARHISGRLSGPTRAEKRTASLALGGLVGLAAGSIACVLFIGLPRVLDLRRLLPVHYNPLDSTVATIPVEPHVVPVVVLFAVSILSGVIGGGLSSRSVEQLARPSTQLVGEET